LTALGVLCMLPVLQRLGDAYTVSSSEDYLGNSTVDSGIKPTQFEYRIENAKLNPRQRWAGLTWVPFVSNFTNKSGCYGLFKSLDRCH